MVSSIFWCIFSGRLVSLVAYKSLCKGIVLDQTYSKDFFKGITPRGF